MVGRIKTSKSHLTPSPAFYSEDKPTGKIPRRALVSEDRAPRSELDWAILSQESFLVQTRLLTSVDVADLDKRPFAHTALS